MRPVSKGVAPRAYTAYSNAQPDLIARLGRFCSYCGRFVASGIHVEHKRPKLFYPADELLWANFLLACTNCNSSKSAIRLRLTDHLWPDADNTMRAFIYTVGGLVRVNRQLPKRLRRKASRTIFMVGLDKAPGQHRQPTNRDYRWQDRFDEWNKANTMLRQLQAHDTPSQRQMVVQSADKGIFPVWMQAFSNYADIKTGLIGQFPNTDPGSFNAMGNCLPRAGGQL